MNSGSLDPDVGATNDAFGGGGWWGMSDENGVPSGGLATTTVAAVPTPTSTASLAIPTFTSMTEAEAWAAAHNTTVWEAMGEPNAMEVGEANEWLSFVLMSCGESLDLSSFPPRVLDVFVFLRSFVSLTSSSLGFLSFRMVHPAYKSRRLLASQAIRYVSSLSSRFPFPSRRRSSNSPHFPLSFSAQNAHSSAPNKPTPLLPAPTLTPKPPPPPSIPPDPGSLLPARPRPRKETISPSLPPEEVRTLSKRWDSPSEGSLPE